MYRFNVTGLLIYVVLFGGWFFGVDTLLALGFAWLLHTVPVTFSYKTKKFRAAEQEMDALLAAEYAEMTERILNPFANHPKSIN